MTGVQTCALPISKSSGFNVEVLDHLDQAALREKYREHGVRTAAIETVDFVWKGERYLDLTRRPKGYGWIVASHVVEHMPDLVAFLQDCDSILQDDGVLALAVPDKRYCFDHLRPESSLGAVVDAHEIRRTLPSVGTAAEYFLNVCERTRPVRWADARSDDLRLVHSRSDALSAMEAVRQSAFLDMHSWCFTPSSFRSIVNDLYDLGLIKLREVSFIDTVGHEFFIALGRHGAGLPMSRLELMVSTVRDNSPRFPNAGRWTEALKASLKKLRPMR